MDDEISTGHGPIVIGEGVTEPKFELTKSHVANLKNEPSLAGTQTSPGPWALRIMVSDH